MKEKLKIGILLNKTTIPSWEFHILKELSNSDFAKIVLLIRNKSKYLSEGKRKWSLVNTVFELLEKADKRIFKEKLDYNLQKDVTDLLKDVSEIDIYPGNDFSNDSFNMHAISEIKKLNLDIIIKFGFHILKGDVLKIPKYGIWTYSIDDYTLNNIINSGFWEVIRNHPVTCSNLAILKENSDEKKVIFSSWESTCSYSININRNRVFWRSTLFIPRIMNGLHKYGDNYLSSLENKYNLAGINKESLSQTPSFLTASRDILNYIIVAAKQIYKKVFYTDSFNWQLSFNIENGNIGYSTNFSSFKKLLSPKGIFWADPFVIAKNDHYYIFVEEFIYRKNKAHISVLKLDDTGNLLSSERIIERPYHMSYPFVFMIDGTYYMIPETSKNRTIELYKCSDFPYKWEFDRNIMENISAVDTTLLYYENKWWLFTSLDQTDNISGSSTELFLFYADNIFSDNWKSHPCNPIVSDVRKARPAGKLFIHEDKIYRPAQDCSVRYGKGFSLNQITKLTDTEYNETVFSKVEPLWDKKLKGTHTFNFDKDFTIIDAYSFRKRTSII
jgi:hypothetical protein